MRKRRISRYCILMVSWKKLALCVGMAACSSAPVADGGLPVAPGRPCANDGRTGYTGTILQLDCDGTVTDGRASWSVSGTTVILDFSTGQPGPTGVDLVNAWPPLEGPPWLGHSVRGVNILSPDRLRVEFGEGVREPERIFADPRLAGDANLTIGDGDVRDAIDRGEVNILTRHAPSIEYARSLGIPMELVEFDQLYIVAFAETVTQMEAVADEWVQRAPPGHRRLAPQSWAELRAWCGLVTTADTDGTPQPHRENERTVAHSPDDAPGRWLAERLASATMRNKRAVATPTGRSDLSTRLRVRPAQRGSLTDVAVVFRVHSGQAHPCSIYGEAMQQMEMWVAEGQRWEEEPALIGEVGLFRVNPPIRGGP